jgi:hypothetical protein
LLLIIDAGEDNATNTCEVSSNIQLKGAEEDGFASTDVGQKAQLDNFDNQHTTTTALSSITVPSAVTTPSAVSTDGSEATKPVSKRPLILYAYSESEKARPNIEFFIAHGLHAAADFLFIFNGDTDVASLLPKKPNIRYIHRTNDCYDLGAYAEVLTAKDLYKGYKRFILINASIRGPFLPHWADGCWSDMYLNKVTEEVKVSLMKRSSKSSRNVLTCISQLVGMTINCDPQFHLQSMIWATDIIGIETLLYPSEATIKAFRAASPPRPPGFVLPELEIVGINSCPHDHYQAIAVEVSATLLLQSAGYKVDTMMTAYHASEKYAEECFPVGDVLYNEHYYGTNVHPYELIFMKTGRGIDPAGLPRWTNWTDGIGYSSYDHCHN